MALFKILRGNATNLPTEMKDGYAYFCTDTHDFYIDYIKDGQLTRGQLNAKDADHATNADSATKASKADKLTTGRTIGLKGAVTATATTFDGSSAIDIPVDTVKESYLTWGGKNLDNNMSPIDGSILDGAYNNAIAFFPNEKITMQNSADGNTWTVTHDSKNKTNLTINSSDAHDYAFGNKYFEIIFDNTNTLVGTLNKVAIEGTMGTTGQVQLYGQLYNTNTWVPLTEQSSMAGTATVNWTILNINQKAVAGYTANTHYQKLKLSFYANSYSNCSIRHVYIYGFKIRTTPSNMGKYGKIYKYDSSQNVVFPKKITAATLASTGNTTVAGTLSVSGAVTSGALTASSLKSNGALTVSGNSTLSGTLTTGGAATFNGTIAGKEDVNFQKKLTVSGDTTLAKLSATNITASGTLGVTGATTLSSLTTSGNTSVGGTLKATGATTLSSLTTSGNTSVGGTLGVTGTTTLNSTLTVKGKTTLGDNTNDSTTVNGTLTVTGATSLNSTLGVKGSANFTSDVTVNGSTNLNGSVNVNDERLDVGGGTNYKIFYIMSNYGAIAQQLDSTVTPNNYEEPIGIKTTYPILAQSIYSDSIMSDTELYALGLGITNFGAGFYLGTPEKILMENTPEVWITQDGDAYFEGNVDIHGCISTDSLAELNGGLAVKGVVSTTGNLVVAGDSYLNKNATVGTALTAEEKANGTRQPDTFTVNGLSYLNGNTYVTGLLSANELNITGDSTIAGDLTVNETLRVNKGASFGTSSSDTTSITGGLNVSNGSTINGNVYLNTDGTGTESTNIRGSLNVINEATFNNLVSMKNGVAVDCGIVTDTVTASEYFYIPDFFDADCTSYPYFNIYQGDLEVSWGATIGRDLYVDGKAYLNTVDIMDNIELLSTDFQTIISSDGMQIQHITTGDILDLTPTTLWITDSGYSKQININKETGIAFIDGSNSGTQVAGIFENGVVSASNYMSAPEFRGDLTGQAQSAAAIEWIYF